MNISVSVWKSGILWKSSIQFSGEILHEGNYSTEEDARRSALINLMAICQQKLAAIKTSVEEAAKKGFNQ